MHALLATLLLLSLPAQAQEAKGLSCEADANNPKDPYRKMRKANEDKIEAGIRKMGVSVGRLPRQEMMAGLNTKLTELCEAKTQMQRIAASITAKTNEAAASAASQSGCENYDSINRQLSSFRSANDTYQSALKAAYEGEIKRYKQLVEEDHAALKSHMQKPAVMESFKEAWGKALLEDKVKPENWHFFLLTKPISEMVEEHKLNASRKGGYDELSKSILSLKEKCPSLAAALPIGDEKLKASAQRNGNEWGKLQLKPGDPGYVAPASPQPAVNPATGADPAASSRPPAYVPPTPDPPPVAGQPEESWISRNKGTLLVGAGAAAVVGGVLWYKHEQDKKKDKSEQAATDASSGSATATSTSTATTTSTAGAKTLSVSGFPPSARPKVLLPKITASISGSGSDGIEVSIACVSSCSLKGTLKKTTVNGSAEFTDLYFESPHGAVQLRVSAPGINSVASPGSFVVSDPSRE